MGNRIVTIIACFALGFGVFWLNGTGFIPPVVSQVSCRRRAGSAREVSVFEGRGWRWGCSTCNLVTGGDACMQSQ